MNRNHDKEDDKLHRLLHQAIEFETDEKRLINNVRSKISERDEVNRFFRIFFGLDFKLKFAGCSAAVAGAFLIGFLLPLPITDLDVRMATGIAFGNDLAVSILAGIDPLGY